MTATTLQWTGAYSARHVYPLLSDHATDTWIIHGARPVTRDRLLTIARGRLEILLRAQPPDENSVARISVATMNSILNAVIDDEQPTPQLFAAGDGAVTCEWLVGGSHLMVTAEADGTVYWCSDPIDGMAAAELESPATDVAAEEMAREFRTRLNALAKNVSRRHPVVGSHK